MAMQGNSMAMGVYDPYDNLTPDEREGLRYAAENPDFCDELLIRLTNIRDALASKLSLQNRAIQNQRALEELARNVQEKRGTMQSIEQMEVDIGDLERRLEGLSSPHLGPKSHEYNQKLASEVISHVQRALRAKELIKKYGN